MKTLFKALLSCALLSSVFALSNCNRNPNNGSVEELHPLIKTYFGNFKSGSEWEYMVEDSNYTEKAYITVSATGINRTTNSEMLEMLLLSNLKAPIRISGESGVKIGFVNSPTFHILTLENDMFRVISPQDTLYFIDTVKLNGFEFNDVLVSKSFGEISEVWVAPNVGIIKKVFGDNPDTQVTYSIIDFNVKN